MKTLFKLLFFILSFIPVKQSFAQVNRYDQPTQATFRNNYVPMYSYSDELYLRALAYNEAQKQKQFESYSSTAYVCLKNNQITDFINYAQAALKTGYYNSLLYYNLGIAYYLTGKKFKGKRYLKKAKKEGYFLADHVLTSIKKKETIKYSHFQF